MKMGWAIFSVMALLFTGSVTQLAGQGHAQNPPPKYTDHDRQVAKDYVTQHHDNLPTGLRDEDRKPEQEEHLQPGVVLTADLRRNTHPVPPELEHNLSKPPAGSRHVAVAGHIVLVDKSHRVQDVIHPEQ